MRKRMIKKIIVLVLYIVLFAASTIVLSACSKEIAGSI